MTLAEARRRTADQRTELGFAELLTRTDRDDLLREDVERCIAQRDRVEEAVAHAAHERSALDELIAGEREHPALRRATEGVARATDALEQCRDRARRTELDHQIDGADVDAELERGRRDRALDLTVLELLLRGEAQDARHRAVVRHHVLLAEPLLEGRRCALDEPPRVDEQDRGAMLGDQLGDPVIDPAELLVRRHGPELVVGDLDREIDLAAMSAVDDVRHGPPRPDEQPRDRLDRLLRRRQPDPHRHAPADLGDEPVEPLERDREVGAALVARHGVDLVDDHRAQLTERGAPLVRGQQDVQRLRRGDEDVRRALRHLRALARRRIARADADADLGKLHAAFGRIHGELRERRLEVAMDVVRQRLERRDVEDRRVVAERCLEAAADQRVHACEEGRERLAGAGRRRDQNVFARADPRPAGHLRFGGRTESLAEPSCDERMECVEHVTHGRQTTKPL